MSETVEQYDVAVTGEVYQVVREEEEGAWRICVFSRGRLRFSLPDGTPHEQVRTFVQVYAIGLADGQSARSAAVEYHIRGRLGRAAQRLGRAVGSWKAGGA